MMSNQSGSCLSSLYLQSLAFLLSLLVFTLAAGDPIKMTYWNGKEEKKTRKGRREERRGRKKRKKRRKLKERRKKRKMVKLLLIMIILKLDKLINRIYEMRIQLKILMIIIKLI